MAAVSTTSKVCLVGIFVLTSASTCLKLRSQRAGPEEFVRGTFGSIVATCVTRTPPLAALLCGPWTKPAISVYSEGDLLPSLIVDVYDNVLVLQTLSQGSENLKSLLTELLWEEFKPRAVIERNDARVRAFEGLELRCGLLAGDEVNNVEISQHGVRFMVSPLGGQKTGAFLDQRENYLAARSVAHGRALDCFTFSGGFALHIAPSCESVLAIDISGDAIAAAERNAELNGAHNVQFRTANVFDALREMEFGGERFDMIVLDPPAFAKRRATVKSAARGYKEINLRALKLLNPGGILV